MLMILRLEQNWDAYFEAKNITSHNIIYEDFAGQYEQTLLKVLTYLGVENAEELLIPNPVLKRQSDETSEIWLSRFIEDYRSENELVPVSP